MQLVRGLHNLDERHQGSVLTIGNFDGVHLGHQAILKRLIDCAKFHQVPATVMIFEPHPEELFAANNAPARLTSLREKLIQLKRYNIERVVIIKFNRQFSQMTAEDFVTELLVKKLGIKHLIIGDDFRFGYQRQGNYSLLQKLSTEYLFELENTKTLSMDGNRVSSTLVRDALARGDLSYAEKLLCRPYSITGRVFHGDKRGRTIGFPTANILIKSCVNPLKGVYAVKLILNEGTQQQTEHFGVANIGQRPTVGGMREQLEVHCFNFDEDIYGQAVMVQFFNFIRREQKFDGLEQLVEQIGKDVIRAKKMFALEI